MNEIVSEKPPSVWAVALRQLRDPMNIMLVAVLWSAFSYGQVSTGILVALLILPTWPSARQELKAEARSMPCRRCSCRRKWKRRRRRPLVPAVEVVPATSSVEAGDIVPADGSDQPVGDPGDPGGGAHRRERAIQDAGALPSRRGALGDRNQHALPEHVRDLEAPAQWS